MLVFVFCAWNQHSKTLETAFAAAPCWDLREAAKVCIHTLPVALGPQYPRPVKEGGPALGMPGELHLLACVRYESSGSQIQTKPDKAKEFEELAETAGTTGRAWDVTVQYQFKFRFTLDKLCQFRSH